MGKMNLRHVLLQAKWELKRPLGSKSSILTIALVFVTIILLSFLLQSFGSSSSITLGEYKLYSVHASDSRVSERLSAFPRLKMTESCAGADVNLLIKNNTAELIASEGIRGFSAYLEVAESLKEVNEREIEAEMHDDPNSTYILKPLWVKILYSLTEEDSVTRLRRLRAGVNGSSGNLSAVNDTRDNVSELLEDAITPSEIEIPFLFTSLISSFTIIAPLFFFCLYFASSILREKINRRGTYLLSSPHTSIEIILGKMLPYLLAVLIATSITSITLGKFTPWVLSTVAVITLALMGISLIVSILSKSPEDMNFTLLFVNLIFFAYLFYPAMFSGMHPISRISPITAMEEAIEGTIDVSTFLFILSPTFLLAVVSLIFGGYLFRDDVLFTQRPFRSILNDMLQIIWIERLGRFTPITASFISGILFIPVVYFIELAVLFLLFPLGARLLFPLVIIAASAEEIFKILGVSALMHSGKLRNWLYGGMAGAGFFIVERSFVWAYFGFFTEAGVSFLLVKILLITFMVHAVCSLIAAYGFSKTSGNWENKSLTYLSLAIMLHALFNFMVIYGVIR